MYWLVSIYLATSPQRLRSYLSESQTGLLLFCGAASSEHSYRLCQAEDSQH